MFHFVVEYNRRTRDCLLTEFASIKEAMRHRLNLEKQRTNLDIEICALSSNSPAGLTRTHNRYFSPAGTRGSI